MYRICHLNVDILVEPLIPFFEQRLRLENDCNFFVCCSCLLLWKSDYLTVFFIGTSFTTFRIELDAFRVCKSFKLCSVMLARCSQKICCLNSKGVIGYSLEVLREMGSGVTDREQGIIADISYSILSSLSSFYFSGVMSMLRGTADLFLLCYFYFYFYAETIILTFMCDATYSFFSLTFSLITSTFGFYFYTGVLSCRNY